METLISFNDCKEMSFADVELIQGLTQNVFVEVDNGKEIRIIIDDGSDL